MDNNASMTTENESLKFRLLSLVWFIFVNLASYWYLWRLIDQAVLERLRPMLGW